MSEHDIVVPTYRAGETGNSPKVAVGLAEYYGNRLNSWPRARRRKGPGDQSSSAIYVVGSSRPPVVVIII